jgi:hypothetical protein
VFVLFALLDQSIVTPMGPNKGGKYSQCFELYKKTIGNTMCEEYN